MAAQSHHRVEPARREEERVTPLELFFDLVFVLAITQCTALMAADPSWEGIGRGLLVLGVLWWSWVGYAWLTSVVDPEDGWVRLVIFVAMGALLVVSLCVPKAFNELGLTFAVAYAVVRAAHIALFVLASRHDADLRRSVTGLAVSTAIGSGLLVAASFADGPLQAAVWGLALALDMGGPFVFGAEGWKLVPGHFAERHGLIVLIALGESIVAIGVGADARVDRAIILAASAGMVLAGALWWAYFDVVSIYSARNLAQLDPGRELNELARDAYSYLHFPMIAGIVLVALGMKTTLAHVADPLPMVPAVALLGGAALYLLAHVAFAWRDHRRLKRERLVAAAVLVALVPAVRAVDALVAVALAAAVLVVLLAAETALYRADRERIRHQAAAERL